MSVYKKYGFLNFIERWDTETSEQLADAAFPSNTVRASNHHFRTAWAGNYICDGTRVIKSYFTQKKDTDFRILMNMTLNDAVGSLGIVNGINLCGLYNYVDSAYGTSLSTHGNYTMGELFRFDGSDYSRTLEMNFDIGPNRLARLKQIGLINDDNTLDNVLTSFRLALPSELSYQSDMIEKRHACVNFIPNNVDTKSDYNAWNQKGYYNPSESDTTIINKLGTTVDYIVPLHDFTCVKDTNVPLEFGRPVKLVSNSVTLTGRRGFIIHVYD